MWFVIEGESDLIGFTEYDISNIIYQQKSFNDRMRRLVVGEIDVAIPLNNALLELGYKHDSITLNADKKSAESEEKFATKLGFIKQIDFYGDKQFQFSQSINKNNKIIQNINGRSDMVGLLEPYNFEEASASFLRNHTTAVLYFKKLADFRVSYLVSEINHPNVKGKKKESLLVTDSLRSDYSNDTHILEWGSDYDGFFTFYVFQRIPMVKLTEEGFVRFEPEIITGLPEKIQEEKIEHSTIPDDSFIYRMINKD